MSDLPLSPDSDLSQVSRTVHAWDCAMISNDAHAIGRHMTDDWVIIGPDGRVGAKAEFLDFVRRGLLTHDVTGSHDLDIRVYGDAAVFEGPLRYTRVWRRFDDAWRIVAGHVGPMAEGTVPPS